MTSKQKFHASKPPYDGESLTLCRDCKELITAKIGVLEPRCPSCFGKHIAELRAAKKRK